MTNLSSDGAVRFLQETIENPPIIRGQNCKIYNNYDTLYLISNTEFSYTEWFNITYDIKYLKEGIKKLEKRLI